MALFVLLGFLLSILSLGNTFALIDKPGKCPVFKAPAECPFKVRNDCLLDMECPGSSKCCPTGCHRVCVSQEGVVASEKKERAECPAVRENNCPGNNNDQCRWDSQCLGGQKCCFNGCKFMCLGEFKRKNTPVCRKAVDIGIIMDTSGSISQEVFNSVKYLIAQITHGFKVSHSNTHISLLSFGSSAETLLTFHHGRNRASIQQALSKIAYNQGTSRLDLALVQASKHLFKKRTGMRKYSTKFLLVLTDGKTANSSISLGRVADKIKAKGVEVIAVGVSKDVDVYTMLDLASGDRNLFKLSDFTSEDAFSNRIAKMICNKAPESSNHNAAARGRIKHL